MAGSSENEDIETKTFDQHIITRKYVGTDYSYKHEIMWLNVILFTILHLLGCLGLFVAIAEGIHLKTFLWLITILTTIGMGVTVGAHRYFTHKCFKAKTPLKVFLVLMQTASGQNSIFEWVRDHRLHHRFSDTDADPHNSKRGFFFSHMGWLMMKKHPYVKELGRKIDMSDLKSDQLVMLQKKYYLYLFFIVSILIPAGVPYYFFGESFKTSLLLCFFTRYVIILNGTWLVNSAAHLYGTRPYDKKLQPVESWFVSLFAYGEGWHNYHHAFPWDYKAAELPTFINVSTMFINLCAKLGLAYDLKAASPEMIVNRIMKTGDGTHYFLGNDEAKSSVTATGPIHPLNPTYNVTYPSPNTTLNQEGLPLFESDVLERNIIKRKCA